MKRTVIRIDEAFCNGCGNCIDGCHEGALQLIDGKAVMISDLYCDGLGACIGECPVGAIAFEEREAAPYDEEAVMERLAPKGEAVLIAHLRHLHEHNEHKWVAQGLDCLKNAAYMLIRKNRDYFGVEWKLRVRFIPAGYRRTERTACLRLSGNDGAGDQAAASRIRSGPGTKRRSVRGVTMF
ncbi:MAG: ATP-binding protein [Alistipes indistinctus]